MSRVLRLAIGVIVAAVLLTPAPAYAQYADCVSPARLLTMCQARHGPTSVPTAVCKYEECFGMTLGQAVKVTAADDQGLFPRSWLAWPEDAVLNSDSGGACWLQRQQHKVKVTIPDGRMNCYIEAVVGGKLYAEHFASNPSNGCLAWLECKLPLPGLPTR